LPKNDAKIGGPVRPKLLQEHALRRSTWVLDCPRNEHGELRGEPAQLAERLPDF
jgi:hypothetical protein